jgi:hypothetical protein
MTAAIRGAERRLFGGFAAKQPITLFLKERASFREPTPKIVASCDHDRGKKPTFAA